MTPTRQHWLRRSGERAVVIATCSMSPSGPVLALALCSMATFIMGGPELPAKVDTSPLTTAVRVADAASADASKFWHRDQPSREERRRDCASTAMATLKFYLYQMETLAVLRAR